MILLLFMRMRMAFIAMIKNASQESSVLLTYLPLIYFVAFCSSFHSPKQTFAEQPMCVTIKEALGSRGFPYQH